MSCSKIASDLLFKRLSLSQIAETHNISKAEVVKSISKFFVCFPNSCHNDSIRYRFKFELTKAFLLSNTSTLNFADEYGMDVRIFRKLMKEIIDDPKLISSDILASKLFTKTMAGTAIVARYVPNRIVKRIAEYYVCKKPYTQDGLASIYCTTRETISAILQRAIAENIVDDVTAEKIIIRIRRYSNSIDAYADAFDKRAKLKATETKQS